MPQNLNLAEAPVRQVGIQDVDLAGLLTQPAEAEVERTPGELAFSSSIHDLAERMPEIAGQRDAIERYGSELVRDFGIHPEVFQNPANTMFMSALAQRRAALEAGREGMDGGAYSREQTFIASATVLLAGKRSDRYPEYRDLLSAQEPIPDAEYARILDRFTNKQVTAELQTAIDDGLLDEVKKRLGITDGDEDPFVLHVLNIGGKRVLSGMIPIGAPSAEQTDEQRREDQEDIKLYEQYAADLAKQSAAFEQQMGWDQIPIAWASRLDGSRHFVVTLPTAEKLLYTDEKRDYSYTEQNFAEDRAIVEHEFAHTQGHSLCPDGNLAFGLSFEERRAEQMAGNKMGYQDTKGFIDIDLQALTGIDVTREVIVSTIKGGDAQTFWVAYANALDLQAALEVALIVPELYLRGASPLQKEVNEYLGGYDGVERRLYEHAPSVRRAQIAETMARWANAVKDSAANASWRDARRKRYGLRYVTNMLEAAVNDEPAA